MSDTSEYSQPITDVYSVLVDKLLENLARHFNVKTGKPLSSFEYEAAMLAQFGAVKRETAKIISDAVAENEPMIEKAVEQAMLDAIASAEPELLGAARSGLLEGAAMSVDESVSSRLQEYSRQAKEQMNLVNTVMLKSTADAYRQGVYAAKDALSKLEAAQKALNEETGAVITGVSSLQQATHAAVKKMADVGLTGFVDAAGRHWSPEAYAYMDIKTTTANAATRAVLDRNEEYGNSYISVRTNATARPGCAPWQGKVIDMAGVGGDVTDYNGSVIYAYPVQDTSYGEPAGIFGINCHHGPPIPFIPGYSEIRGTGTIDPAANDERYKLTQKQRALEREVKQAKREAVMYKAAGDKDAFEKAALKVRQANDRLKNFVNSNDSLVLDHDRTWVFGYNKSVSASASSVANKYSSYHYHKDGTIVVTDDWKSIDHVSIPRIYRPYAVIETKSVKAGVTQIDRTFYDGESNMIRQTHSGPHKRPDEHPYGNNGEHAHVYSIQDGKMIKTTRNLTDEERKESGDILD